MKIKHIFSDLDRTLWDFEANSHETLEELFANFKLNEKGISNSDDFIRTYKAHNEKLWGLYRKGKMSQKNLRRERFQRALSDFGIKCIIAPSFADIFYNNCFQNGILPIVVDEETASKLIEKSTANPGCRISIDLNEQSIKDIEGDIDIKFDIDGFRKYTVLNGLDDIGLTLKHEAKIRIYEEENLQK